MRAVYEIINPSDAYTMASDDRAAACVACMVLGGGAYALTDADGVTVCPLFLFGGGHNEWLTEQFGADLESLLRSKRKAIAAALDSVLVGSFGDRRDFEAAVSLMTPQNAASYSEDWHDRRRTSMSDIGARAKSLATAMRKSKEKARRATAKRK